MKIAIYSGTVPSTTFIEQLIHGVAEEHQVYLFGVRRKPIKYLNQNIRTWTIPQSGGPRFLISVVRFLKLLIFKPGRVGVLMNELKRYDRGYAKRNAFARIVPVLLNLPDVFHIQWAKDLEKWMFLKEKLDVKVILSLRGAHINYSPIANEQLAETYKKYFPKIDAFHAVSEDIKQEAQKYKADAQRISVIHSPVAESLINSFETYKKKSETPFRICSIGRFHWIKGMDYLLDALKILNDGDFKCEYLCISSNQATESFLFQITQLGLQDRFMLLQDVHHSQVIESLRNCDVLVLPSLKEGIANVVLEAMSLGIPVIATNSGGMSEVVIQGETGWLVPPRNPKAIANAIEEIHNLDETALNVITKNAHDLVSSTFDANKSISKFIALYQSV